MRLTLPFLLVAAAAAADSSYTRTVQYSPDEIIEIKAKVRFTTTVVLPPEERILEFVTGDGGRWVVEGAANLAYIKPGREGVSTNVTLVTASGNVYTFLCREVGAGEPDLKVVVKVAQERLRETVAPASATVPAAVAAEKERDEARLRVEIPASLEHYRFEREKTFRVEAIYTDGRATFIQTKAAELPAVYEVLDGQPALLNFQVENGGLYVVPKVIQEGYLALGKKRLKFFRP